MELWAAPTPNGWKVTIMVEELCEAGSWGPSRSADGIGGDSKFWERTSSQSISS